MSTPLIVYGAPPSQPSRAVYWTCLLQGLPFALRQAGPDGMRSTEFVRLNPKSQMPTIVDDGFSLYEMPAILIYLCEKHGWEDIFPKDLERRAAVHQYLHFHHSSTRLATFKLMAPHVTPAFGGVGDDGVDVILRESIRTAMSAEDVLGEGQRIVGTVAGLIETGYLGAAPFLCGTDRPTIADIAAYEELAQLAWAGLFDFAPFPRLARWLETMAGLPFHEPAHRYNFDLGDIRTAPLTLERFVRAHGAGVAALRELGVPIDSHD